MSQQWLPVEPLCICCSNSSCLVVDFLIFGRRHRKKPKVLQRCHHTITSLDLSIQLFYFYSLWSTPLQVRSLHKTTTYKFPKGLVLDTGPIPNHLRCLPRQPQHSWFQVAPTLIQNEGLISAFQTFLQHLNDTLDETRSKHLLSSTSIPFWIGAISISWHHATYPKYRNVLVCVAPVEMMKWLFPDWGPHIQKVWVSGLWIYDDGILSFYGEKSRANLHVYTSMYIYIYTLNH